jgi:hypothetical protein
LPVSGPEDPTTVAIPRYAIGSPPNPVNPPPPQRLAVNSDPTLYLTTISVNVSLRAREVADPALQAALVMFRRAANIIARIEDALVVHGRPGRDLPPPGGLLGVPNVYEVTGNGRVDGLLPLRPGLRWPPPRRLRPPGGDPGGRLFADIVRAIGRLENRGQLGPFACLLDQRLFSRIVNPTGSLVLPRDRLLPFLQGPLLRSSVLPLGWGALIALSAGPVEIVVASDISVQYLQVTLEPRYVFRVCERVALRVKERRAIQLFFE